MGMLINFVQYLLSLLTTYPSESRAHFLQTIFAFVALLGDSENFRSCSDKFSHPLTSSYKSIHGHITVDELTFFTLYYLRMCEMVAAMKA